jgi:hypothetical protein
MVYRIRRRWGRGTLDDSRCRRHVCARNALRLRVSPDALPTRRIGDALFASQHRRRQMYALFVVWLLNGKITDLNNVIGGGRVELYRSLGACLRDQGATSVNTSLVKPGRTMVLWCAQVADGLTGVDISEAVTPTAPVTTTSAIATATRN